MSISIIDLDTPAPCGARPAKVRLSAGNAAIKEALSVALGAIFLLDDAGSSVVDIDIRGGTPVLRIDRPPAWVRGVTVVRRPIGPLRVERLLAAPFHGAQLEWTEQYGAGLPAAVAS